MCSSCNSHNYEQSLLYLQENGEFTPSFQKQQVIQAFGVKRKRTYFSFLIAVGKIINNRQTLSKPKSLKLCLFSLISCPCPFSRPKYVNSSNSKFCNILRYSKVYHKKALRYDKSPKFHQKDTVNSIKFRIFHPLWVIVRRIFVKYKKVVMQNLRKTTAKDMKKQYFLYKIHKFCSPS